MDYLRKKYNKKSLSVLYISYDGALDPIPQSQVIPYLMGLIKDGYIFHWVSFEKYTRLKEEEKVLRLKQYLKEYNIFWHPLPYYRRPYLLAKACNIINGIIFSLILSLRHNFVIIHCRSEIASIIGMVFKVIFRKKLLYDRRAFMAEDYIEGEIWKGGKKSFLYKLLIAIDSKLLSASDRIVVLTNKMKDWLMANRLSVKNEIMVIPCCVDLSRFDSCKESLVKAELGLGGKFVFVYSGSLGTWYLLEKMLDFFVVSKKIIPNAHFLILTMSDQRIVQDAIKIKNISKDDVSVRNVSFDDMPKFIQCADAAICFIKSVISKLASSPTKFAEFLASGTPVIINTGIGDCDEIVEKDKVGIVVKDFTSADYEDCVRGLLLLMQDKGTLRKRCVESAKDYFSLTDGVEKYRAVYRSLLQE